MIAAPLLVTRKLRHTSVCIFLVVITADADNYDDGIRHSSDFDDADDASEFNDADDDFPVDPQENCKGKFISLYHMLKSHLKQNYKTWKTMGKCYCGENTTLFETSRKSGVVSKKLTTKDSILKDIRQHKDECLKSLKNLQIPSSLEDSILKETLLVNGNSRISSYSVRDSAVFGEKHSSSSPRMISAVMMVTLMIAMLAFTIAFILRAKRPATRVYETLPSPDGMLTSDDEGIE
eukprot:gnl/TRDRNA2_/TRDRNA2_72862_c0_seq1.p1 gnl/TRDRNA2_/TRDRNA2_72862_c0~~gnl/TRDRNA2_/TRDRNA2_72862_c0_seq1.p1  ORF type:complete len:235 (-),score=32.94 gnl/TRDRNA2_/TRDRNA2_72862_c0_seq1:35-739(-)